MTAGRQRTLAFALVVTACLAVAAITVAKAVHGTHKTAKVNRKASLAAGARLQRMLAAGTQVLFFRSLDRKHPSSFGNLAFAPLRKPDGPRVVSGMRCDRVAFDAGRGLCLLSVGGLGAATKVTVFDGSLHTVHSFKLAGIPTRARISPDGRYAGITTFVGGHSYGSPGKFSTATEAIDLRDGRQLGNLEQWTVTKDGKPFHKVDFNFWGLTFARDHTFYATLGSGNTTYLVRGNLHARSMRTVHENVECPSLSPDGTRIAYKKKVGGPPAVWHFYVLDLRTMHETPLAEQRTVDDQIAWLDDRRVLYGVDETTWIANSDGTGTPAQYLAAGVSPQVQHPPASSAA